MKRFFLLMLALVTLSFPCFSSVIEDEKNAEVVTRQVLNSGKVIKAKEIILSGTFNEEELSSINKEKCPMVEAISLKFVNQPTFRRELVTDSFLESINKLSGLNRLSLENQFFEDEHLSKIPKSVNIIDVSHTCVFEPQKYTSNPLCKIINSSEKIDMFDSKGHNKKIVIRQENDENIINQKQFFIPNQDYFNKLSEEKLLIILEMTKKALEQK